MKPDINAWWGRPFKLAVLAAAAIHVVALLTLSIPTPKTLVDTYEDWFPITPGISLRTEPVPTPPGERVDATKPTPIQPEILEPAISPQAPLMRTIPPTTLNALTEPTQPLIVKPAGIGRRTSAVDARRLAIARAESLVNSRLATLPGAGAPEPKRPIALAEDGGVAVVIPWPGFLPADRHDDVWRANRCRKTDRGDDDDKPGEAEARRAQC